MDCNYTDDDVKRYITKHMTAEEERDFVEHLGSCDSCRDRIIKLD